VKVAGVKKLVPGEQRDPYSPDQLIKIMKSPLYTGHKSEDCRYKPGTLVIRDGYFWTPLISVPPHRLHPGPRLVPLRKKAFAGVAGPSLGWIIESDLGGCREQNIEDVASEQCRPLSWHFRGDTCQMALQRQ
jgi:hypothetical protein